MRPRRDGEKDTAEVEATEDDSKYTQLTKFIDQIDEYMSLQADEDQTRELEKEFVAAFEEFRKENPKEILGGSLKKFRKNKEISESSEEETLAALTLHLELYEDYAEDHLNELILNGELKLLLDNLANV